MNKFKNTHLIVLISALILLGLGLFLYRWYYLQVPLKPAAIQQTWVVEANLRFQAGTGPVKAQFYIPDNPPQFAILDETFISRSYGVTAQKQGANRLSFWSIRRASGLQSLYYRSIFYRSTLNATPLEIPQTITKPELTESEEFAVDAIVTQIRERSADIRSFAVEALKILKDEKDNNAAVLMHRDYSALNILQQAIIILNAANIHAEQVNGLFLKAQKTVPMSLLLAVYDEKDWFYINPLNTQVGLPADFLIWFTGGDPISAVEGGQLSSFSISISDHPISALELAQIRGDELQSNLQIFSLFNLPLKTQYVYHILLTVPIGALIILLLRNFVGISTFGTFMPVLIALAFRETELLNGIILFTFIVAAGLAARFYLDQLRLLLVPRLTAILTIVVMIMLLITILSQNLGLERGLSIALFPMVILTMTIERMCIIWDERGAQEAIISGIGSLFAASIAYLVMRNDQVEYLFFAFPELLISLLGIILWLGQYHGYRLSEIRRFKSFLKE